MSKPVIEAPVDAEADGGNFATMPKDISHVTFYFDLTPDQGEDDETFYVKVDVTDSMNDDLDTWYDALLTEILAQNAEALAGATVTGVAIKFGNGEFFYEIDGDSTDIDEPPGGDWYVQGSDLNVTYSYADLFPA